MTRQLVSGDEATPAKRQHHAPCSDCPFARTALPGWLGVHDVAQWLRDLHGETWIECHTMAGAQCAGAAIYRANVGKLPRYRDILRLPADPATVFASPDEFADHHWPTHTAIDDAAKLLRRYLTQHCTLHDQDGLGTLCECAICRDTRTLLERLH